MKKVTCGQPNESSPSLTCERSKGHRGYHWGETLGHTAFYRRLEEHVTDRDVLEARAWLSRRTRKQAQA